MQGAPSLAPVPRRRGEGVAAFKGHNDPMKISAIRQDGLELGSTDITGSEWIAEDATLVNKSLVTIPTDADVQLDDEEIALVITADDGHGILAQGRAKFPGPKEPGVTLTLAANALRFTLNAQ